MRHCSYSSASSSLTPQNPIKHFQLIHTTRVTLTLTKGPRLLLLPCSILQQTIPPKHTDYLLYSLHYNGRMTNTTTLIDYLLYSNTFQERDYLTKQKSLKESVYSLIDRIKEKSDMGADESETPRSPEATLGMQVEDLWDVQEAQLSPTEKLNACFESIPVSAFPLAPSTQVVEISSDTSLSEAVKLLARHKLLSAPVVDVNAAEDATWIDRYIGIVEFAGIVVWILHQSEKMEGGTTAFDIAMKSLEDHVSPAIAAAASGMSSPRFKSIHPDSPTATCGDFFETLTASDFYKNTKVGDISGCFRWAPFLALQTSNSFLTMLLLLSKYRMKSVPVVDLGEAKVDNIITQSAVIHMLEECAGLHWFESWCSKKLCELGLPLMKPNHIIKVYEDDPVLQAFKIMRQKGVGGIPVVASDGNKAVGNISIRDIQYLLIAPEIYREYRSITTKNFLTAVRSYREKNQSGNENTLAIDMVTCCRDETLKEVIGKLDATKIHRIYVVDEDGNLEGVVTLRDIISRLVHEPRGYFGDFFDGVLPLPANSRV